MPTSRISCWLTLVLLSTAHARTVAAEPTALTVEPAAVTLVGPHDVQRLLVTAIVSAGSGERLVDASAAATFRSANHAVAVVSGDGVVRPVGDGSADIVIDHGGRQAVARVTVKDFAAEVPVSFRNQVVPLFTRLGCNGGGCHGKAAGQGGFKLSLFGFDPGFDYDAVVKEGRGRRVFPAAPEYSLLLVKAAGAVAHGGGQRLRPGSEQHRLLTRWIAQGMPPGSGTDPDVVRIACTPKARVLGPDATQQLLVTAFYSDGTRRDVTHEAQFRSNNEPTAAVDATAAVRTGRQTGDAVIMARYMGHVDVCTITVPLPGQPAAAPGPELPRHNYIDELVQAKWRRLRLVPSPLADDATFLRRASLDAIGTLPTPDEVRAFVADPDPRKRAKWIDRLLDRPEYADFWAVKWGDLLRNKRRTKEAMHGTFAFHAWIRQALARNMPYDQFVRAIVAAQGTVESHAPVVWYREVRRLNLTNDTAQLFLGIRMQCAQCHHHPYEKWSQDDYYRFQAIFARVAFKNGDNPGEQSLYLRPDAEAVRHPATGALLTPRALDGAELMVGDDDDPRQRLADWMADPKNPFFARAIANRLWGHFLGRGLVEPVDDMRVTNPPSNPELLEALARDLVEHRFDLKHLIRTILVSSTYQLSSDPGPGNAHDRRNYARAYPRRLPAEALLDGVCQVTGAPERFAGFPAGTRAIQLPDESVGSYFLDTFGRPTRESPCECERSGEANLAQALHLLNSGDLQAKVGAADGRLARLVQQGKPDAAIVEELYLAVYARPPQPDERQAALKYLARQEDRQAALEDLLWVLLNTKEFLFNH